MDDLYIISSIPEKFLENIKLYPNISTKFINIKKEHYTCMMHRIIFNLFNDTPMNLSNIYDIHKNITITDEEADEWLDCLKKTCNDLKIDHIKLISKIKPVIDLIKTHNPGIKRAMIDNIIEKYKNNIDITQDLLDLSKLIIK